MRKEKEDVTYWSNEDEKRTRGQRVTCFSSSGFREQELHSLLTPKYQKKIIKTALSPKDENNLLLDIEFLEKPDRRLLI